MTITVNAIPFDIHSQEKDVMIFRDFSGESIDDKRLQFKRIEAHPTKDFVGMEKGEVKMSVFDTAGKLSGVYTISTSVRADVLEADRVANMTTVAAIASHAATVSLVKEGRLPYGS